MSKNSVRTLIGTMVLFISLCTLNVRAEEGPAALFYFRSGSSSFDANYRNNRRESEKLGRIFLSDTALKIKKLVVVGGVPSEGAYAVHVDSARFRAQNVMGMFKRQYSSLFIDHRLPVEVKTIVSDVDLRQGGGAVVATMNCVAIYIYYKEALGSPVDLFLAPVSTKPLLIKSFGDKKETTPEPLPELLPEAVPSTDQPDQALAMANPLLQTPEAQGAQSLAKKQTAETKPWLWMAENFFPDLRAGSGSTQGRASLATMGSSNWKRMREIILSANMDDQTQQVLLDVIDNEADPMQRLSRMQALCPDMNTYIQLQSAMLAGLLYEPSALSTDNWALLREHIAASDMPFRDAVLVIIDNTPISNERVQQLQAFESGEPYRQILERFLPKLLSVTDQMSTGGSGMSFSDELSPATKERAAALAQKQVAERQTMQLGVLDGKPVTQIPSSQQEQDAAPMTTRQRAKAFSPRLALKTDLVLWGGVMPDFKMGTWTPNLSLELYFARRWSVQVGGAYSNWNALSGTKELYALSVGDLEVRHWFGKPSSFLGFYIGLYGQFGQYDVQTFPTAQTGSFWSAGLGAGWMQRLSRNWAIEAEVRGGYRSAQNDHYDIERDAAGSPHYYYNHPSAESHFMPSVRLNIVYRIGKSDKK